MKGYLILLLFTGCVFLTSAQQSKPSLLSGYDNDSRWQYDAFSYADFGTGEIHKNFAIMYEMSPKLFSELQVFYNTYRAADIIDISYRMRYYPSKKLYLFSGVGVQIQRAKVGRGLPTFPFRTINGVGYDPTKNINIEVGHHFNFSQNSSSSLFDLKGKFRF